MHDILWFGRGLGIAFVIIDELRTPTTVLPIGVGSSDRRRLWQPASRFSCQADFSLEVKRFLAKSVDVDGTRVGLNGSAVDTSITWNSSPRSSVRRPI